MPEGGGGMLAAGICSDSLVARPGGQVTGKGSLNMAAMSCSILG